MGQSFIIDKNMPVALGNCIRVKNVEQSEGLAHNEPDVFVCIQVENETGENEYCILLDEEKFAQVRKNAMFCDDGNMVAGRIYTRFVKFRNCYCVKLKDWTNQVFIALFDIGEWSRCYVNAIAHPKSCTRKSLLTDVLD